jgi:hypothetical protein
LGQDLPLFPAIFDSARSRPPSPRPSGANA